MKVLAAAIVALFLIVPMTARSQSVSVEDVISDQIDAFRSDDFAAAFEHASPMIKRLFGTPERFGNMVREGYPMVHRPDSIEFLDTRNDSDRVRKQRVLIRDAQGVFHTLEYEMILNDGEWQINGVRMIEAPQFGA